MAEFSSLVITENGKSLISKIVLDGGSGLQFTKIATSETVYSENNLPTLTILDGIKQTTKVSNVEKISDTQMKLVAAIENSQLKTGYTLNSIGLYANDPEKGEILYAVCRALVPGYIPAYNGLSVSGATFEFVVGVGNASQVILNVDPAAVATIGDVLRVESNILSLMSLQVSPTLAEYFFYSVDDEGNAVNLQLTGNGKRDVIDLVVPLIIDGHPVINIASDAFSNSNIETVIIPDTLSSFGKISIGNGAFQNNASLKSVSVGNSISKIPPWCFHNCPELSTVRIAEGITGIGEGAFDECRSVSFFNIPDSVTTIESKAFRDCSSAQSFHLSESLQTLGERVFQGCSTIKSLTLPDSLMSVSSNLLEGCVNLKKINIGSKLTTLGVAMFSDCTGLEELVVPDTVEKIDDWCFCRCFNLKKLYLPKSIQTFGRGNIFEAVSNVETIIYVYLNSAAYAWVVQNNYKHVVIDVELSVENKAHKQQVANAIVVETKNTGSTTTAENIAPNSDFNSIKIYGGASGQNGTPSWGNTVDITCDLDLVLQRQVWNNGAYTNVERVNMSNIALHGVLDKGSIIGQDYVHVDKINEKVYIIRNSLLFNLCDVEQWQEDVDSFYTGIPNANTSQPMLYTRGVYGTDVWWASGFVHFKKNTMSSVSDWEQYLDGHRNEFYVLVVRFTPTIEDITPTDAAQELLKKITAVAPTCSIKLEGASYSSSQGVSVSYNRDLNHELNEIKQAIINLGGSF